MPGGATYGAAADFNKFSESQIRWVRVAELHSWQADEGRKLVLLDVRDPQSFEAGSIPGARNFSQGSLFINWQSMQPQIDDVVAAAAYAELVLFANTGGVAGPAASRDLYVLNFLAEVGGLTVDRMVRLEGGLDAWKAAGYEVAVPPPPAPPATLDALLEEAGLSYLGELLAMHSLESLMAVLDISRVNLLDALKDCGLKLPERQKVANVVSRAAKLRQ